jgi:hypothetical protein
MIVPTAIVNTLLMPPLYGVMWLASSDLRRASSF